MVDNTTNKHGEYFEAGDVVVVRSAPKTPMTIDRLSKYEAGTVHVVGMNLNHHPFEFWVHPDALTAYQPCPVPPKNESHS